MSEKLTELLRLCNMLDENEIEIATTYVSNLLLSHAKPAPQGVQAHRIESIAPRGDVTWSK
jgi:hypothetical protein